MPVIQNIGLIDRLTELGDQAAKDSGMEVVEIQLRGSGKARLLRVYIDKLGGVTHGDCQLISERLSVLLDESDVFPGEEGYTLEVSSPGIDRNLSKPRDFERVVGQKIRVALRKAISGQTRFEGKLAGLVEGVLELEVQPGQAVHLPLDQIQKANLKFEW